MSASRDDPAGTRRGRPPTLAPRGRLVGASAVALVAMGIIAERVDIVGLGIVLLGLLFVVLISQYPSAIFIWRRYVELAWRVERPSGDPALYAGRPLTLTLEVRNRAPRALGAASLRPVTSPNVHIDTVHLAVPARVDRRASVTFVPRSAGVAMLHGAALTLSDPLGLTEIEAYFPSPIALPILPRLGVPLAASGVPLAHGPERARQSAARLAGQGGDLRELREHRPGDPWKQIAWKATARRGRLMVRELERETQSRHLIVLDVSGRMRQGRPGAAPLDLGIDLVARYVRGALDAGDQVGLITVDARAVASVPPSDRPGQRRKLSDALALASAAYDEDVTELSDAELCSTVGRYILLQEGEETRTSPPPIDDPRWARIVAAPSGELFELHKLLAVVREIRRRYKLVARAARAPLAHDPQMAELRAFCRDRCIPLPPRLEPGRGLRGLAAALQTLRTGRVPDRILLVSQFDGASDAGLVAPLAEGVARLKRRGVRIWGVAPHALPEPAAELDPIDELLLLEHTAREAELGALTQRLGVPVRGCRDAMNFRLERGPTKLTSPAGRAA